MHFKRDGYSTTNAEECTVGLIRMMSTDIESSQGEAQYIQDRISNSRQDWKNWIGDGSDIGYKSGTDTFTVIPIIASAAGGSGLRAALFSAAAMGALTAQQGSLTKRIGASNGFPPPPGIFGAKTFGVGAFFSGANFAATNTNGPGVRRQVSSPYNAKNILLTMDLIHPAGPNSSSPNNQQYYDNILSKAYAKASAGLHPSMTDIWSSMLAYHFINGGDISNFYSNDSAHGTNLLWSSLMDQPNWINRQEPFPIVSLHTQVPTNGNEIDSWNDRMVYETSPLETGSYDPRLMAMTATKYLGTHATAGKPDNNSCQVGFDQVSYIMGTTSSPFYNANDGNQPSTSGWDSASAKMLNDLLQKLQSGVQTPSRRYDVGNWPNPFKGIGNYSGSSEPWLQLGGAQNYIPIEQLMVKARNISIIIALDSTGENTAHSWPDGTAMHIARNRVNNLLKETHQVFPPIPDDFNKTGVSLRPIFFGCNATTATPGYPLIIYIPNAPPVDGSDPVTNPNGFRTSYSQKLQDAFIQQAALSATSGFLPNSTKPDPDFLNCFKCAIVDRSRLMSPNPVERSNFCAKCFSRYCYDQVNEPSSSEIVGRKLVFTDPGLSNDGGSSKKHGVQLGIGIVAGVAALIVIVVAIIFWRRHRRGGRRRGDVPPPINTGAGAKYAPLHDEDKIWSGRQSYEPMNQSYEMGSQDQHTHYRDNPSSGFMPTPEHKHFSP